jgi:hypothetical protein
MVGFLTIEWISLSVNIIQFPFSLSYDEYIMHIKTKNEIYLMLKKQEANIAILKNQFVFSTLKKIYS